MDLRRSRPLDNAELWAGLFWLGLGLFVTWAGRDLGTGTLAAPGSGFLPFWAGLLMCAFSLSVVVGAARHRGPALGSLFAGARWGKVLLVIASLAAYAALLDVLGFLVATVPLMLVLLRAVDPAPWRTALPLALLSTLGIWWVLKRLLLIQLPAGVFEIG
ncbi:MAG TPA: tripartite tricarboxylate transporter TctB family protein [Beijerinckiaceae bacterium]